MSPSDSNQLDTRPEHDSLGEIAVPIDALWGAQTQRAVQNFSIGGRPMPAPFIAALGLIKWAAAGTHAKLGLLPSPMAAAIQAAAIEVAEGQHDAQFPVDVYQTGSGTSSNMNANEVIAHLVNRSGHADDTVHPNDHVNLGQSSNDVVPSALHVAATLSLQHELRPALTHLIDAIDARAIELADIVKTGRTHLMDAMPVTFGQELSGWSDQLRACIERLDDSTGRLQILAIGGTATGTGINAPPGFAQGVCQRLNRRTGLAFRPASPAFAALASQDTAVEASGHLKVLAVALMKIANDLRWMNSGPLAGLGEISLPVLQPGSSIMPGKVNPVIPEAVAMAAATVMGHDATVTVAGQSGSFQLNVMLPVIADALLDSIGLLTRASRSLADEAIAGLRVNTGRVAETLARNPILVTALNPIIGYELGARVAKEAYASTRSVKAVALEMTDLDEAELDRLLDPLVLTRGGVAGR